MRGQAATALAYLAVKDKGMATEIAASFADDDFKLTGKLTEAIDSADWLMKHSFEKFENSEIEGASAGTGASGIEATDKPPMHA